MASQHAGQENCRRPPPQGTTRDGDEDRRLISPTSTLIAYLQDLTDTTLRANENPTNGDPGIAIRTAAESRATLASIRPVHSSDPAPVDRSGRGWPKSGAAPSGDSVADGLVGTNTESTGPTGLRRSPRTVCLESAPDKASPCPSAASIPSPPAPQPDRTKASKHPAMDGRPSRGGRLRSWNAD